MKIKFLTGLLAAMPLTLHPYARLEPFTITLKNSTSIPIAAVCIKTNEAGARTTETIKNNGSAECEMNRYFSLISIYADQGNNNPRKLIGLIKNVKKPLGSQLMVECFNGSCADENNENNYGCIYCDKPALHHVKLCPAGQGCEYLALGVKVSGGNVHITLNNE